MHAVLPRRCDSHPSSRGSIEVEDRAARSHARPDDAGPQAERGLRVPGARGMHDPRRQAPDVLPDGLPQAGHRVVVDQGAQASGARHVQDRGLAPRQGLAEELWSPTRTLIMRAPRYGELQVVVNRESGSIWRSRDDEPDDCSPCGMLCLMIDDGESSDDVDLGRRIMSLFERVLSPRQEFILRMRITGSTLEEISVQCELTKERVRQLEKDAINRLRAWSKILLGVGREEADREYGFRRQPKKNEYYEERAIMKAEARLAEESKLVKLQHDRDRDPVVDSEFLAGYHSRAVDASGEQAGSYPADSRIR